MSKVPWPSIRTTMPQDSLRQQRTSEWETRLFFSSQPFRITGPETVDHTVYGYYISMPAALQSQNNMPPPCYRIEPMPGRGASFFDLGLGKNFATVLYKPTDDTMVIRAPNLGIQQTPLSSFLGDLSFLYPGTQTFSMRTPFGAQHWSKVVEQSNDLSSVFTTSYSLNQLTNPYLAAPTGASLSVPSSSSQIREPSRSRYPLIPIRTSHSCLSCGIISFMHAFYLRGQYNQPFMCPRLRRPTPLFPRLVRYIVLGGQSCTSCFPLAFITGCFLLFYYTSLTRYTKGCPLSWLFLMGDP
ncbi:hypothetical protein GALMADRAFT_222953 [Galerina marginata CBS 339.88]|uniref:Uncharacterized protein n=1 Tax=Galerina marginata (strain CBS 339.88) TaxID=685588 RepID=A0A067TJG2_GALM3|nr:hypothetical protein GALMADRAFT_222953 [Galerina marginata CBS 339.88]